ncbi:MarR family winged helix-turn-helix transcriptional regulator [Caenimonas terrae]|uniref:MarR family winged helix-turn-helix transcriptional regulator n=1 Tax=Caenimonas terrae TaxID=696074 RepID=A0ABW0N905_9BURK
MKWDFRRRFGFLVSDVARLYGQRFDRAARDQLGLSQPQCRLLGVLAANGDDAAVSQAELAQRLGLSAMAVGSLCDRMASAGWIRREPHATDRRVNLLQLEPRAAKALARAMEIGDSLNARALSGLSAAERTQLLSLLAKVRDSLLNEQA